MNNNDLEQKVVRKKYSPQFKDQALERADKESVPQVAKDLGLAESLLYSWRAQRKQGGSTLENQKLQQAELTRYISNCNQDPTTRVRVMTKTHDI